MPNTKIVATLGPASDAPDTMRRMLDAGVDVFRLNASHGKQEDHARRIDRIREAAIDVGRNTAILLDLQGPKIRLDKFEGGSCELETGSKFTISTEPVLGNARKASTSFKNFATDVRSGDRVLLADGTVELRVVSSDGVSVETDVISGGTVGDHKGINLPGARLKVDSLTPKDCDDLAFGLSKEVDILALSFVRTADDVQLLRRKVQEIATGTGRSTPIVAKIEKPEGWQNIRPILDVSDGAMVARGDLGVEVALEKVPFIQKAIIRRARRRMKFVITATQMLESMIENPTPTRAEVSDVANAIYDGTDAVMLSAETSVGKYPVEAVKYMARIAAEAERSTTGARSTGTLDGWQASQSANPTHAEIIAMAANHAASTAGVLATVVFTSSGSTARLVSRFHPPNWIYAITPSDVTARRLSVNYGVQPIHAPQLDSTDEMIAHADRLLRERGVLKAGDSVLFVAGQPVGKPGTTNMIKLHRIGDSL